MPFKNPEDRKSYISKWNEDNKEKIKEYKRVWRIENIDRERASKLRNADRAREQVRARRDEINAQRRWRYANRPEVRAADIARALARQWDIIPEEWEAFLAMYDQECFYCGNEGGAVDHLTPRSRGGEDRLYNLVPACKSCNSLKSDKTPGEWYDGLTIRRSKASG